MKTTTLTLSTPEDFDFWRTVYSHGWCSLRPFSVDKEHRALNRILTLTNGSLVLCQITDQKDFKLNITMQSIAIDSSRSFRSQAAHRIVFTVDRRFL